MIDRDRIRRAVFAAIDELNLQVPPERHLEKSPDAVLFGPSSRLTSLNLVSLILKTEQQVAEAFDVTLTLVSENAMSRTSSPFQTVGTLIEYVAQLLEEGADA